MPYPGARPVKDKEWKISLFSGMQQANTNPNFEMAVEGRSGHWLLFFFFTDVSDLCSHSGLAEIWI